MALVVCNAGEVKLLTLALKTALSVDESFTLHLYKNNYTPVATSAAGDFTVADFTGYTGKTLTRAGWAAASSVTGTGTIVYGTPQTWTCGATGNTVYGVYILDASNALVWAEQFAVARVLADTDTLTYTPAMTLVSA